jgi:FkbM family methyltransferase
VDKFLKDMTPFFLERAINYVDVGAHQGGTYLALREAGFKINEAHLFEPNPHSVEILRRVLSQEIATERVFVHQVALSDGTGTTTLLAANTMSRVVESPFPELPAESYFEAKRDTLDRVSKNFVNSHISILKIDVEGHELRVLDGAKKLLEKKNIDVIYVEAGMDPEGTQQVYYHDLETRLRDYGYRIFKVYEQKNEWITDSPLLRRVNLAFMSDSFADSNPYRLSVRVMELEQALAHSDEKCRLSEAGVREEYRAELAQANERCRLIEEEVREEVKAELSELITANREAAAAIQQIRQAQKTEMSSATEERARLVARGAELEAELQNVRAKAAEAGDTKELTRRRDQAISYAEALKKQVDLMQSSASWKLTAPFRAIARLMRHLVGKKGRYPRPKPPVWLRERAHDS